MSDTPSLSWEAKADAILHLATTRTSDGKVLPMRPSQHEKLRDLIASALRVTAEDERERIRKAMSGTLFVCGTLECKRFATYSRTAVVGSGLRVLEDACDKHKLSGQEPLDDARIARALNAALEPEAAPK